MIDRLLQGTTSSPASHVSICSMLSMHSLHGSSNFWCEPARLPRASPSPSPSSSHHHSSSHLQAGATIPFTLQKWEQDTDIEIWGVTCAAQIPDALD